MKNKILCIILLIVIPLTSLTSCKRRSISGSGQDYLISAIGFDNIDGELTLYLEAVIVNSEDTSAERNLKLVVGNGPNAKVAFANAERQTVQPLTLSHCTAAVIGSALTSDQISDICSFLYDTDRFSLAMVLVSCETAGELLSLKPNSSIAMGYDIFSYLERLESKRGAVYENRLHNFSAYSLSPQKISTMPYLAVSDEEFEISGIKLFHKTKQPLILTEQNAFFYSALQNGLKNGTVIFEGRVLKADKIASKVDFSKLNDNRVGLTLFIKGDESLADWVRQSTEHLLAIAKENRLDIFEFYNQLYSKNHQKAVKYSDSLLNAQYSLNLKIIHNNEVLQ